MFFREILNEDLGCASYFVADGGEAMVIDPKWEIEEYLRVAEENGFRISRILEIHNHADHLSGHGREPAGLRLGDHGGPLLGPGPGSRRPADRGHPAGVARSSGRIGPGRERGAGGRFGNEGGDP